MHINLTFICFTHINIPDIVMLGKILMEVKYDEDGANNAYVHSASCLATHLEDCTTVQQRSFATALDSYFCMPVAGNYCS